MANYENGAFTRQVIVDACKLLFYEKGFHETSYSDICKAAHVNRTTIYYHFKDKEAMRYEVVWEYTVANKRIAEKYCDRPEYHYIVAICMLWKQLKHDEKLRRFFLSACVDYPVLTGKADFSNFYTVIFDHMWGELYARKNLNDLSFATLYGYIRSCMRMVCENPDKYDALELFEHCARSSVSIWDIPDTLIDQVCMDVKHYLSLIPEEEMQVRLP